MKKLLWAILLFAAILRIYHLNSNPPSISWDEAAVGYNGWSVWTSGHDEWGNLLPTTFKSFGDYKHPIHVYITGLSTVLFGVNPFGVRFPAALLGVLNVYVVYLLAKEFFGKEKIALLAAFLLSISPFNIQFSRFNHELNFATFFFMLGLYLFYLALHKKPKLLPYSSLAFGLSLLSYHSAKVVVPPIVLLLYVLNFTDLKKHAIPLKKALLALSAFVILIALNPNLLGLARVGQTGFSKEQIEETSVYKRTQNHLLGRVQITTNQYYSHFQPRFLFLTGDRNPRHSSQVTGTIYKTEVVFLGIGLIALLVGLFNRERKKSLVLLSWFLLAPLPSAAVLEAPHAARAMFLTGILSLTIAYGLSQTVTVLKPKLVGTLVAFLFVFLTTFEFTKYYGNYLSEYSKEYAIEWQYGMEQIVNFAQDNPQYKKIYITKERSQPYIFFLYGLKYPQEKLLTNVKYDSTISKSYNTIQSFDNGRYNFGSWNIVNSQPTDGTLYVLTPAEYDSLFYKDYFVVKNLIKYPNSTNAFYLIATY